MSLSQRQLALLLIAPGLALVAALFLYPLCFSLVSAFTDPAGGFSLQAFGKAFELYSSDILFTIVIVVTSCALTALAAVGIAGTLTLGENPWIVGLLRALYRWPLFIPFIVAAQCMRTFLAKNGMLNNTLVASGLLGRVEMWRGGGRPNISVAASFVWRCLSGSTVTPFPHPAHRTGRADLPHPALGQDITPLLSRATPSAVSEHSRS